MRAKMRWLQWLSNALLGVALGLAGYYALTTAIGMVEQRRLAAEVVDVGPFASEFPDDLLEPDGPERDFAGWDAEDRAYWDGLGPGSVFGRIVIPRMELDTLVINGVSTADLRRGPGWIDWSDLPGPTGTCGISGHRTTFGAPFGKLGELVTGDTIDLFSPYRRYRYRVTETLVVRPDQTEVVAPTDAPSLTLTACHPPYSAQFRLAVKAELIEVRRLEQVPE